MLADPLSLSIGGVATSFPRTSAGQDQATYKSADGIWTYSISHAYGKRVRRTVRLDWQDLDADVMDSSLQVPYTGSVYLVTDMPTVGVTIAAQLGHCVSLLAELSESSYANMTSILQGQS